jgi:hypothetical protein
MHSIRCAGALLAAAAGLAPALAAQSAADSAGVRAAVRDDGEGGDQGESAPRGIRPEVVKYGFYIPAKDSVYRGEPMSFAEMNGYANNVKRSGKPAPATAPKEIEILDVADQTAAAKLTAWWGIDYLQLARYDGRWMIVHVLWQSPPRSKG